MWKWFAAAGFAAGLAIVLAITLGRSASEPPGRDVIVDEFRATERSCIAAFNAALARQRRNEIDEIELAAIVESDVLVPWRAMHARLNAAPAGELYTTLRRYVETRQLAWEAYAAALRSADDAAARPHYDVYHQKNAEAQADARTLGRLFRDL